MITNNKKINKKGSAVAYALVMTAAVAIILTGIIQFLVAEIKFSEYTASKEEAFEVAEAGIYWYRWYLSHQTVGKTALQIQNFWNTGNPIAVGASACGHAGDYEVEYKDPSGAAIGKYCLQVTPPVNGSTIVTVKSTGWTYKYPNSQRIIQVRYRQPAWSEYIFLNNAYTDFGASANVQGKVFCNSVIRFDGVANNLVMSGVSSGYDSSVGANKPGVWTSWSGGYNTTQSSNVFLAGTKFPVPTIDFATVTADLSVLKSTANSNGTVTNNCTATGCYFDNSNNGREIVLKSDGTFTVQKVNNYSSDTNSISSYSGSAQTFNIPNNGVIYVEDNVWLRGTINNKKVTVVAANLLTSNMPTLFIENDIKYTNYNGNDVLGIVSQDDIQLTGNSEDNLEIDGALVAQNGAIWRDSYGNAKTQLTIKGAMASHDTGGFYYSPHDGYQNRLYQFDNNLLYNPPPYFPTGSAYLLDLWQEL